MKIAVLVPTLGRPHALEPLLENIRATTPAGEFHVWFVCDQDDEATAERLYLSVPGVIPPADDFSAVINDGTYPVKTNAGYEAADRFATNRWFDGDWLVLPTADDVVFHEGWYEATLKHFEAGAQVVGTNDLTPATRDGKLATMPIVRRSYIEEPGAAWGERGTVFNESLHHNFVDRVLWELALHRGVAAFEPESIIEHRHHGWKTREIDDTDRKGNMQNWGADKATYERMRAEWTA